MTDDTEVPDDGTAAPSSLSWSRTQQWLDDLDREPANPLDTAADADDPETRSEATEPDEPPIEPTAQHRFNKTLAAGFAVATVLATVTVTAALLAVRTDPRTADESTSPTTKVSILAAPNSTGADTDHDTALPYTASASCPPGSTTAQSVAGADPSHAWVCVRGGTDGQVLSLDLGRTMVITAISLTPGWVGSDTSGADQWPSHRVLTRVQWIFNDTPATVLTQHTGNVRGEAVQPIPNRGVLASKITMLVLETARAPTEATPPTPAPGGLVPELPGPPDAPPPPAPASGPEPSAGPGAATPADPADNTFAVSAIKILGHPPQ